MTVDGVVRWAHLVAAAVWTGGLIALGAVVGSLRASGAGRDVLRAVAAGFGRASWPAMAVAVGTGLVQSADHAWNGALITKVVLVAVTAGAALAHQFTARRTSPAMRGALQGLILLLSLAVFAAAVAI